MWNAIRRWFHGLPMCAEVIESVLMVTTVLIMHNMLLTTYFHRHPDLNIEDKRRSLVLSHNLTPMLVLLGLAMIWAAQIQTLASSTFAVAATIVVTTKELITCLSGNIPRSVMKQYSVGDYIEVNDLRGRVVDISLLSTLMTQIGPHPLVGQFSGKMPSFPNNLLLNHCVRRDNTLGPCVIHTAEIPVPIHLDLNAVVPNLKQVLEPPCTPYVSEISHYLDAVQAEKLFITPAAQPRVTRVSYNDRVYSIIVHYVSPVSKWLEVQQAVLDEFLHVQYHLLNPHSQIHYINNQESTMLPGSALTQIYPVIMTPSRDGKYFHNYILSLLNIVHASTQNGWPLQAMMQHGESLITRTRNNCMVTFMVHPEWTHLFWIDSDIGFSAEAFYRLLLADRDVAASVYPLKREDWPAGGVPADTTQADFGRMYAYYTVNIDARNENDEVVLRANEKGFMKVNNAPTGFMVIKRGVFEKTVVAYPELNCILDSNYNREDNGLHYRFFDRIIDPESKHYLSEDYTFCRLRQQIGGRVYVDVQSSLTHQGAKIYYGAFTDSLQTNVVRVVFAPTGTSMSLDFAALLAFNPRGAR